MAHHQIRTGNAESGSVSSADQYWQDGGLLTDGDPATGYNFGLTGNADILVQLYTPGPDNVARRVKSVSVTVVVPTTTSRVDVDLFSSWDGILGSASQLCGGRRTASGTLTQTLTVTLPVGIPAPFLRLLVQPVGSAGTYTLTEARFYDESGAEITNAYAGIPIPSVAPWPFAGTLDVGYTAAGQTYAQGQTTTPGTGDYSSFTGSSDPIGGANFDPGWALWLVQLSSNTGTLVARDGAENGWIYQSFGLPGDQDNTPATSDYSASITPPAGTALTGGGECYVLKFYTGINGGNFQGGAAFVLSDFPGLPTTPPAWGLPNGREQAGPWVRSFLLGGGL